MKKNTELFNPSLLKVFENNQILKIIACLTMQQMEILKKKTKTKLRKGKHFYDFEYPDSQFQYLENYIIAARLTRAGVACWYLEYLPSPDTGCQIGQDFYTKLSQIDFDLSVF